MAACILNVFCEFKILLTVCWTGTSQSDTKGPNIHRWYCSSYPLRQDIIHWPQHSSWCCVGHCWNSSCTGSSG